MNKYKYLLDDKNKVVCHCGDIKKYQIIRMHKSGIKTLEQMSILLPVCCGCKCCKKEVEEIIEDLNISFWQKIKEIICFWRTM